MKPPRQVHPVALVAISAPYGLLLLLPFALALEYRNLTAYIHTQSAALLISVVLPLGSVGALLAFAMLLAELRIVQLSSGLTLSVAGVCKELLTVLFSVLLLGDKPTMYNMVGFFVCLMGIVLYHRVKTSPTEELKRERKPLT